VAEKWKLSFRRFRAAVHEVAKLGTVQNRQHSLIPVRGSTLAQDVKSIMNILPAATDPAAITWMLVTAFEWRGRSAPFQNWKRARIVPARWPVTKALSGVAGVPRPPLYKQVLGPEVKFVGTCAKLPRYKTRTYVESVKTIVVLGKRNLRAPVTAPRFCCPAHPARAVANRASENLGI
jgi:hypothetical protein